MGCKRVPEPSKNEKNRPSLEPIQHEENGYC